MTYTEWYEAHATKHQKIVEKLIAKAYSQEQIIAYFDFDSMLQNEPEFCLLYQDKKKCHDIESLNCYLCACPHFRFKDGGIQTIGSKTQFSICHIDSKDGSQGVYGDTIHQDCSQCKVPHHVSYIKKNFDLDWKKIMNACSLKK